jgi:hypothetical protein
MKQIFILLSILLLFPLHLFAQEKDLKDIYTEVTTSINSMLLTKTGSTEISGFISYARLSTAFSDDQKTTQQILQIEPVFSYFFIDHISFGIDISYLYQKIDYKSYRGAASFEQIFAGPIAKMYFGEDNPRPFILSDYLFLIGDNFDGGELDFGVGIFWHLTGNFGFNIYGKYGIIWSNNNDIDTRNQIFIGIGISNFML